MIKSANQRYKESKSKMPFKEWLRIEQEKGNLENHEKMLSASGNTEVSGNNQSKPKGMNTANMVGLVSAGLLAYGIYQQSRK